MKKSQLFLSIIFVIIFIINLNAQDWPRYLGPNGNSTSEQKGILRSWPESGPEILWTTNLGKGNGGPIVKDGKVYILDRDDEIGDFMRCFSLSSGEELWEFAYESPGTVRFPGSRSVPFVDGNHVYSCGHNGEVYCIDITTHKPVWNKNVWKDFGGEAVPTWAIVQIPLVYNDLLVLAAQTYEAGVVAYDKLTGEVKWKTPSLGGLGYVSPAIVKIGNEDHIVMITAADRRSGAGSKVVGINPIDGKILWEYTNWSCIIPSPTAFDAGENKILIIGGYEAGAAMIQVEKKADDTYTVTELFKNVDFGAHTKPPVFYKGYFYAEYSTNNRRDGLVCMSMDGEVMWKTGREPGFNKGSMILADGLLFATDGDKTLYLIEPDPSGFKPLASADVLEIAADLAESRYGNQNWAPIALADGKLLIRDQNQMVCVKVAEQ